MKSELCIIGAGPGGYRAAEYAAQKGLHVVIIEEDEVGGTCLNRGCIPTKTYVHSASFPEARQRMADVLVQLRNGIEGILSHPNITLLRGHASFLDAHTIRCTGCNDAIIADNIIIATGSSAKLPPIEGLHDDPRVVDATGLLALDTLPRRLCIIGAGVIGMEFASVFRRFGSEVTVIEAMKECLPMLDGDIAKRLRKLLEKRGITFRMKTALTSLSDIDADIILVATGRRPNTEGLNLQAADIIPDARGYLPTDDKMHITSLVHDDNQKDGIFAIGDVNGRALLAHAAEMQALRAVNTIISNPDGIRFDIMPSAIFTAPEAACVGPTEDLLKEQGIAFACHKSFWRANGKAMAMGDTEGMLKLFVSTEDDRLLGCHAYGAHAAFLVQEISVLMCRDTTLTQLRDMIHIHPTLSEILRV